MKKKWMVAAFGAVAALGLTACSSADEASPSPSASASAEATLSAEEATAADLATLDQITWNEGDVPTLTFEGPLTMNASAAKVIANGDGETIELGQNVSLHYTSYSGADATEQGSTYTADNPETVSLAEGMVDPALIDALVGQNVGVTFVYGAPNYQAADGSAIFMAVTVDSATTPLERATGTAVEPAEGLPTITLDEVGAPSIDFSTAADKPTELVVQTLIEGEGDVVEENDTVTVNYSGWTWDESLEYPQFDSSWSEEGGSPFTAMLTQGALIDGWVQGLPGLTVGSQVMLVIPPDLGYGETGSGETIPADATLVFVVDILATS